VTASSGEVFRGLTAAETLFRVDAKSRAARQRAMLRSAGANSGAVVCRAAGSGPALCTWGSVSGTSVFEAGSVTKAMTGLLFALAIETGEVSSCDRLDRFLPGTGTAGRATLAELATHTSGLPRLPAATLLRALVHPGDPYRGTSLRRLIRDTRRVRPARPGKVAYSKLGAALLGQALAAAAALPFWELARLRVLAPLGMASSGDLPASVLAVPGKAWDLGAFAPAGGSRATVDDLLRLAWVAARPGESPFPAAAADALTPRVAMRNGYVGWCWMLEPAAAGCGAWHNGATGAGWFFIGGSRAGAVASCLPAPRQDRWDNAVLSALDQPADT
jgi:serine-type D-Ala-D-Ala carboxypeptidase/endopeptidase